MLQLFCNEKGEKHDRDYIVTHYKGVKKDGIKSMFCRKCKRLLVKNGKYVTPIHEEKIGLTKEGRKLLASLPLIRNETENKTWLDSQDFHL